MIPLRLTLGLCILFLLGVPCSSEAQPVGVESVMTIGNSENPFFQVSDVVTDASGNIYVADRQGFQVSKFNSQGVLFGSIGRRGQGPGEFSGGPFKIILAANRLFVFQFGSGPLVQIFSKDLDYEETREFPVPYTVASSGQNTILIGAPILGELQTPAGKTAHFGEFDTSGKPIRVILNDEPSVHLIENAANILETPAGNLVLVFRWVNRVDILSREGKLLRRFQIDDLPDRFPGREYNLSAGSPRYLPGGLVFPGAGIDEKGYIFIQAGQAAESEPNTTVYVADDVGDVVSSFDLPPTNLLMHVDRAGYLYTRSNGRSRVEKYRILYGEQGE